MRQIRTRIRTAKNIQQITKAMKMVAAARLKRAQDRVQLARPYSEKMRGVMASLGGAIGGGDMSHPLMEVRTGDRIGVIAVTADRGLCGSYATNILKKGVETLTGYSPANVQMIIAGKKGFPFFRRRGVRVAAEHDLIMTGPSFAEAQRIGREARELFLSGDVDQVFLVYTRFISALTQQPISIQLLPIAPDAASAPTSPAAGDVGEGGDDYLFDPNAEDLLGRILPRYVDVIIYQALLEAVASEHGSRMTAMSSATDNAGKMIRNLTLVLNRARQANITKEISEIVGGAEALK